MAVDTESYFTCTLRTGSRPSRTSRTHRLAAVAVFAIALLAHASDAEAAIKIRHPGADVLVPPALERNSSTTAPFDTWAWDWVPGKTVPDRKVITVRVNYMDPEQSERWMTCAKNHKLLSTDGVPAIRPGMKILFLGNSYVKQVAESLIMSIPESSIASLHQEYMSPEKKASELVRRNTTQKKMYECSCPLLPPAEKGGDITWACDMVDVIALAEERRKAGIQEPIICDSHTDSSPLTKNHSYYCGDNVAIMRLKDGTTVSVIINDPVALLDLDEAMSSVLNETLSTYDVVITNRGNFYGRFTDTRCKGTYNPTKGLNDGFPRQRFIEPTRLARHLAKGGFTGQLYYTADYPRSTISTKPGGLAEEWDKAARANGLNAKPLPVFDKDNTKSVCGNTMCNGRHSCIPGEAIFLSNYVLRTLDEQRPHRAA